MDQVIAWQLACSGRWDVPGVGSFILERSPAVIEPGGQLLLAPQNHIRFELTAASLPKSPDAARPQSMEEREWQTANLTWRERIGQLTDGESLTIDLIGTLQKKAGGFWHFIPDPLWSQTDGIPIQRVIRQNRDHVVLVGDAEVNRSQIVEQATEPLPATPKQYWLAIAATLLIAGLIWLGVEGFRSEGAFHEHIQHQTHFPVIFPETLYQLNP
jgi:hypothetical protein